MTFDTTQLHSLPVAEKLRLVEFLWDDLGATAEPIPLPAWVESEAARRRDELRQNPAIGLTHKEVWRRITGDAE